MRTYRPGTALPRLLWSVMRWQMTRILAALGRALILMLRTGPMLWWALRTWSAARRWASCSGCGRTFHLDAHVPNEYGLRDAWCPICLRTRNGR